MAPSPARCAPPPSRCGRLWITASNALTTPRQGGIVVLSGGRGIRTHETGDTRPTVFKTVRCAASDLRVCCRFRPGGHCSGTAPAPTADNSRPQSVTTGHRRSAGRTRPNGCCVRVGVLPTGWIRHGGNDGCSAVASGCLQRLKARNRSAGAGQARSCSGALRVAAGDEVQHGHRAQLLVDPVGDPSGAAAGAAAIAQRGPHLPAGRRSAPCSHCGAARLLSASAGTHYILAISDGRSILTP